MCTQTKAGVGFWQAICVIACLQGPAWAAAPPPAHSLKACMARRITMARQAKAYHGDPQIKQLIDADLDRAREEIDESDAKECHEALDHAAKLLAGKF